MVTSSPHILIVEARFYDEITDNLVRGAVLELEAKSASYERLAVPGILEIPAAVRYSVQVQTTTDEQRCARCAITNSSRNCQFDGYVVLGCAIKGETHHYEHICRAVMASLQQLTLKYLLAVGNGILTCPTRELAIHRSDPILGNRGGQAAIASLKMIHIKQKLGLAMNCNHNFIESS